MTTELIPCAVLAVTVMIGVYSGFALAKHSDTIHKNLRSFRELAASAENREQLLLVRSALVAFANESCGIRRYHEHAARVLAYVDGRLAALSSASIKRS